MEYRIEDGDGHAVLALTGVLSARSTPETRTVLAKLLLDHGRITVDLSGAEVGWFPALDVFPGALWFAGGWPTARMVLYGAGPATERALRAVDVPSSVPLAADAAAAGAALLRRPVRVRRSAGMPQSVGAPAWARGTVRRAAEDWGLDDDLCGVALLVATELVTNAVEHARTASVLSVGLDRSGLHVAVRDDAPGEVVPSARPGPHGGYGLHVVERLSRSWGVTAHRDGKTVWAVLPLDSGSGGGAASGSGGAPGGAVPGPDPR
jgi:anti-sigma regulatory factor (Ser/Thr protein kinase)